MHDPPGAAASRLTGSLQGICARRPGQGLPDRIRAYLWSEHFWSPSCFAASCGDAPLAVVEEYIASREKRSLPGVNGPGFLAGLR